MRGDEAALKKSSYPEAQPQSFSNDDTEHNLFTILRQIEDLETGDQPLPQSISTAKRTHNALHFFIVTDVIALVLGFIAAWATSALINTTFFGRTDLNILTPTYMVLAIQFGALSLGLMLWFTYSNHYQMRIPFWMETKKIAEAIGFALLINSFLQVVSKQDFSRTWLLSAWLFSLVGIVSFRSLTRKALQYFKRWSIATLIIGNGTTADETRSVLKHETNLGYNLVAQIKDLPMAFKQAGFSWTNLCKAYKADHVIVALDGEDFEHARNALAQLAREHIAFSVVPPTYNLSVVGMMPQFFLGQDVMLMARNKGLDCSISRFLKRSFDIITSLAGLIVVAPVIMILAAIVKLDGGAAFYNHKRIGLNGQVFACLKLRSMTTKSNEVLSRYLENNPAAKAEWLRDHKLKNDPRVTMIGAFMRRASLDELPQLINVLRGEMSIVGPRPIIVAETFKYDSDIAFYYRVRPGITGLWQVSGRNDVTYAERVRMDSWYVRNWSLWHDIAIICKTFGVVLKGRGAY